MAKPIEERRAIVSTHLLRRVALRKREKARQMRRTRIEPENSAPPSLPDEIRSAPNP